MPTVPAGRSPCWPSSAAPCEASLLLRSAPGTHPTLRQAEDLAHPVPCTWNAPSLLPVFFSLKSHLKLTPLPAFLQSGSVLLSVSKWLSLSPSWDCGSWLVFYFFACFLCPLTHGYFQSPGLCQAHPGAGEGAVIRADLALASQHLPLRVPDTSHGFACCGWRGPHTGAAVRGPPASASAAPPLCPDSFTLVPNRDGTRPAAASSSSAHSPSAREDFPSSCEFTSFPCDVSSSRVRTLPLSNAKSSAIGLLVSTIPF